MVLARWAHFRRGRSGGIPYSPNSKPYFESNVCSCTITITAPFWHHLLKTHPIQNDLQLQLHSPMINNPNNIFFKYTKYLLSVLLLLSVSDGWIVHAKKFLSGICTPVGNQRDKIYTSRGHKKFPIFETIFWNEILSHLFFPILFLPAVFFRFRIYFEKIVSLLMAKSINTYYGSKPH